ncbi:Uncharacterised protein [uncultured archaeon]|nr:Uncharacterised protein [uncultured archaeon]
MDSIPSFLAGLVTEAPKRAASKLFSVAGSLRIPILLAILFAFALAFIFILTIPPYSIPPKYSVDNEGWDGLSSFYSLASSHGQAKAAYTTLEELGALGKGTSLVIVSPDRDYTASDRAALRSFVSRGGTLIISDARGPAARLARDFAVSYGNASIVDFVLFNRREDFPAIPFSVGGVSGIFLAKFPVALMNYPGDSVILASTSPESYIDLNANMTVDKGDLKGPFPAALAAKFGEGTVVAISDADAFTNDMILRADNVAFADAVLSDYAGGIIIFDETHRVGARDPALVYLFAFSDKAGDASFIALIVFSAGIAVFAVHRLWSESERKKVEAQRDLKTHTYRDLVTDIHSNAKMRAEPYTWIVLMQYDRMRRALVKSVDPFGKEVSNKDLAKKAAQKHGWDLEDLEGLLARLESIKKGESAVSSLEESTALCRVMDKYLEEAKAGGR